MIQRQAANLVREYLHRSPTVGLLVTDLPGLLTKLREFLTEAG